MRFFTSTAQSRTAARRTGFAQSLFDRMFADFDRSLREMGLGDLSVGKHVSAWLEPFMAASLLMKQGSAGDDAALAAALARNLFGTVPGRLGCCRDGGLCPARGPQDCVDQPLAELLAGETYRSKFPRSGQPFAPDARGSR